MKLTTTIKNFKNIVIGYFSNSAISGDSDLNGLKVIPFSLLNNKIIGDFAWNKFVKAEFITKDYNHFLSLVRNSNYNQSFVKLAFEIEIDTIPYILEFGSNKTPPFMEFRRDYLKISNENDIISANELLTNFLLMSKDNDVNPYIHKNGVSDQTTNEDIAKVLGCINIYYKP